MGDVWIEQFVDVVDDVFGSGEVWVVEVQCQVVVLVEVVWYCVFDGGVGWDMFGGWYVDGDF